MFDTIIKIILTLAVAGILIGLLPTDPFIEGINSIGTMPYIAELNWFIPISRIVAVLAAWATAIGLFFAIAWILRQLGFID